MAEPQTPPAWYLTARFRAAAIVFFMVVVVAEGIVAVFFRENDFVFHLDLGREFLAGEAFIIPKTPYPLGRLVFDGLLALLPYHVARLACYLAATLALGWSLRAWNQMAPGKVSGPEALAAGVFTLAILYPYVIRDLDDCGLQILLLFFLTAGLVCVAKGKNALGGGWLAAAASYKLTPMLFLPFLIYKRRWMAAAWMGVGLVVFNLAIPAMVIGGKAAFATHERWLGRMEACAAVRDPSANGVEPARHQNQSLPMAIARYVQTYPQGHDLYLTHPLYREFGNLDGEAARKVAMTCLLGLAAVLAWRFRRPWIARAALSEGGGFAEPAPEWAAVCILCALLSQLCWLQHLVLAIPAVFLILRAEVAHRSIGGSWKNSRTAALVAIAFVVLVLQRDVVQRDLSVVLLSYKVDTFAVLLAMSVALTRRVSVPRQLATSPGEALKPLAIFPDSRVA